MLGAVTGARLENTTREAILTTTNISGKFYLGDSKTALKWIRAGRSDSYKQSVMHRVKEIRKLTDAEKWNHVPGHLNPAHLPTRGMKASVDMFCLDPVFKKETELDCTYLPQFH